MTDYIIIGLLAVAVVLLIVLLVKSGKKDDGELTEELRRSFDRSDKSMRDEFARSRRESAEGSDRTASVLRELQTELIRAQNETGEKLLREQTAGSERMSEAMRRQTERVSTALTESVTRLQESNEKKLDQMRMTVDEKLNDTLNKRLDSSFAAVSKQLQDVYKSLGEMKELSTGVSDLQRVLTNVKTRGTWAEVQLGNILEQVLAPEQYGCNVSVRNNSERVEYAIKLPSKEAEGEFVWLPIDSKFPVEDYARLQDASERADAAAVEAAVKALENRIKSEAKEIQKYISVPLTTNFAIMFLPTEGLYAEVLRRPGLVEELQNRYHVMVTGPTTLTAFLNTVSMGFKTMAINKKADEVWKVLGAMRTQYEKFEDLIEKAKRKIDDAGKNIDAISERNRLIGKNLRKVDRLEEGESEALLMLPSTELYGDDE